MMQMSSIRNWLRGIAASPTEVAETTSREQDAERGFYNMMLSTGIIENICSNAVEMGSSVAILKPTSQDTTSLFYVSAGEEREVGQLPSEHGISVAAKIRVLGNVDNFTSLDAPRNWFKLESKEKILDVKVEAFQLKPELYVRLEVTDVTPA